MATLWLRCGYAVLHSKSVPLVSRGVTGVCAGTNGESEPVGAGRIMAVIQRDAHAARDECACPPLGANRGFPSDRLGVASRTKHSREHAGQATRRDASTPRRAVPRSAASGRAARMPAAKAQDRWR